MPPIAVSGVTGRGVHAYAGWIYLGLKNRNTVLGDGIDVGWSWMAVGERVFTWALHLPCHSFSLSFIF